MKQSLKDIQLLWTRLLIALLIYPLSKIIFFLFNHTYFSDISVPELLSLLFWGLRFDLSALVLINAPFIILHIVPFSFTRTKWYQSILKTVFLIVNSIAMLADCMDIAYYKFTFKRTTADFFDLFRLGSDMRTLIPHYLRDFWYILLIWVALIFFVSFLYNKTGNIGVKRKEFRVGNSSLHRALYYRALSWIVLNSVLVGLAVIAFRGGLQLRPIMAINASEYVSAKNIPLIVNTPFSIIKSSDLEKLEEKRYFSNEELKKILRPIHKAPRSSPVSRPQNVFILILESFSKEYIGSLSGRKTHTPFLDSLIKESLVFDNAFANGKKSIEGIPAILAGIPSLMNESYITSTYCSNNFISLASTLKEKGYTSAFFHGGSNGTMGFDAFSSAAGFDKYYGRTEYNNEKDYDGDWGIWDEEFFQYTVKTAGKMKTPFLCAMFSLSSHHPYGIPARYTQQFSEKELPLLRSIEYTDFALRKFFESASKEKWFNNTLFVITADHTGPSTDKFYTDNAGLFEIPLIFYTPNGSLKGVNHRTAQHIDILPTVLHYVDYRKDIFAYGNDLLDTAHTGFAVNFINEVFQLFQEDYLLQFDGNNTIALYNYNTDSLLQNNLMEKEPAIKQHMETQLKALIQDYYFRMIHNKMTAENE
jgi:phosphoglycerol transferase MdoB-like AlkP superfamily enzyme